MFDFLLKVIPKLQADLKVPLVFNGNLRDENTPVHKAIREAMINMVTNADFHGRRGVVVNKDAEGFKFANPGTMRVSLKDAIQDNSSDPRNGTMMRMLAMVEYGERAGSGLHRIFHTWETVYHCKPAMETTASGGVDRTVLRLSYEGHQPDTEAMRRLYDNPEAIRFGEYSTQGIKVKSVNDPQNDPQNNMNDPHADEYDPQKDNLKGQNDLLNAINDPQKRMIVASILENRRISREGLANIVAVSESTIKRRLKEWGIYWEGHPKTGHWVIPDTLTKSS